MVILAGKLAVLALCFLLTCSLVANVFFVTTRVILREENREKIVRSIKQGDVQNDCSTECFQAVSDAVDYCNANTDDDTAFLYCVFAVIGKTNFQFCK